MSIKQIYKLKPSEPEVVEAEQLKYSCTLTLKEGLEVKAKSGDYLVTPKDGDPFVMPKEEFEKKYDLYESSYSSGSISFNNGVTTTSLPLAYSDPFKLFDAFVREWHRRF